MSHQGILRVRANKVEEKSGRARDKDGLETKRQQNLKAEKVPISLLKHVRWHKMYHLTQDTGLLARTVL